MTDPPAPADTRMVLRTLQQIPQNPRRFGRLRNWPLALKSVADYLASAPPWLAPVRRLLNRYPKPFQKVEIESADGTLLSGWLGIHTRGGHETKHGSKGPAIPREAILVVPGMFSTKDMTIQKARVLKIFRDEGFHVLAMDLRGFGGSTRVANTAGWKESQDVRAAVQYLRDHVPVTRLHIYSESMGATAALLAAADVADQGGQLVDGGILAISPYADARAEVDHLDRAAPWTDDYFMVNWFFRQLLRLGGTPAPSFRHYLRASAKTYDITLGELLRRSSPENRLNRLNVPALIILSEDDIVVPPSQIDLFEQGVKPNENVAVWRLTWGNHCLYEMMDATWFWNVVNSFFGFYCVLPPAPTEPKGST